MPDQTQKRAARTTRPSTVKTPPVRAALPPATPAADVPAAETSIPDAVATNTAPASAAAGPRAKAARTTPAKPAASQKSAASRKPAAARAAKGAPATPKAPPATPAKVAAATPVKTPRSRKAAPPPAAVASRVDTPAVVASEARGVAAATRQDIAASGATLADQPGRSLSILIVASEAVPFSRTGGLGDLTGGLPAALGALGHRVTLVVPRYSGESRGVPVDRFSVRLGGHTEEAACYEVPLGPNARAILVEHPGFFDREFLYGDGQDDYADNPRRFAFLCRAALEFAARSGEAVDVVHAHDWQTALAPVFLRTEFAESPALGGATTVLTIHDASFQGVFAAEWLEMVGIPRSLFTLDGLEFWGRVSFLKGGIVFADVVTTIGKTYAARLVAGERPSGLEGLLAARAESIEGLVDDLAQAAPGGVPSVDEVARRLAETFERAIGARGARMRA